MLQLTVPPCSTRTTSAGVSPPAMPGKLVGALTLLLLAACEDRGPVAPEAWGPAGSELERLALDVGGAAAPAVYPEWVRSARARLAGFEKEGEVTLSSTHELAEVTELEAQAAVSNLVLWGIDAPAAVVRRDRLLRRLPREAAASSSSRWVLRRRDSSALQSNRVVTLSGAVIEFETFWDGERFIRRPGPAGSVLDAGPVANSVYSDGLTAGGAASRIEGNFLSLPRRSVLWLDRLLRSPAELRVDRGPDAFGFELEAAEPLVEELFRSGATHGAPPTTHLGRHALGVLRFSIGIEDDGTIVGLEEQVAIGGEVLAALEWRLSGPGQEPLTLHSTEELRLPTGKLVLRNAMAYQWAPLAPDTDLSWVRRPGEELEEDEL